MPSPHKPLLTALVPELKEWNNGQGIEPDGWLSIFGSVPQALMYSALFWPEFVEFEGCLLWHDATPNSFFSWRTSLQSDLSAVERVMNHRHITDLFLNAKQEPTDAQIDYLGQVLQDLWSLKLRRDFPQLNVRVIFFWDDPEASDTAQITVYCER